MLWSMADLTLKLSPELHAAVLAMAREDDVSPGQLIRTLLGREVSRRQNARPPVRADERLVAPLRARIAADLAHARGWEDLGERLAVKGYALRAAGGGLAVHRHPGGQRLCKASELGFSYSRLMRRFGTPFPGHSHTWLFRRMVDETSGGDDAPILIEDP